MSSGSQHRHREASPISILTAQPIIGSERLLTGINDTPAAWSSIFDKVIQRAAAHNRTGLCVIFGGAVDWKSRLLKPTAQSTTEFNNRSLIAALNCMIGRLGGAHGMAWFGFCLLSSVFCLLFVICLFFQLLSV
jgi:hypothetical protein